MEAGKLEVRVFHSLQEADNDDIAFYSTMEPQERLDLALELSDRYWGKSDEVAEGRPRVYRVVELDLR